MFWRSRRKITPQPHIKILSLDGKLHLVNTALMDLRYQSDELKFRRGHGDYSYRENGVVRIFQSVCPENRSKAGGLIMAVDYKRGEQDTRFITLDEAIALIVEYEEPYKAQRIITELCGREIPLY